MDERINDLPATNKNAQPQRKLWSAPRVILSEIPATEAKAANTPEGINPTGTIVS